MASQEGLTRKQAREACWGARDAFMACLDQHKSMPTKPDGSDCPSECEELRKPFTQLCMKSWVKYFLEYRANQKSQDVLFKAKDSKF